MKMPKAFCGALVAATLCLPAWGQWSRSLWSGKGGSTDIPLPHPLAYFTANPFLRDDGDEFCELCTPAGRAKSVLQYSIRTVVRQVGSLEGYAIFDVLYYAARRGDPPADVNWKSILVQVGPDRYREIFHLQAFYTTISIQPSTIVLSGSERVLATMDSDGGNGEGCWEGYWWFDRAGPHPLDFSRLDAAIHSRIPRQTRFAITCSNLDLKSQSIQSGIQKLDAQCHACDWVGTVTAHFRLAGPVVEPIAIDFEPAAP